jgi:hypothetical protein
VKPRTIAAKGPYVHSSPKTISAAQRPVHLVQIATAVVVWRYRRTMAASAVMQAIVRRPDVREPGNRVKPRTIAAKGPYVHSSPKTISAAQRPVGQIPSAPVIVVRPYRIEMTTFALMGATVVPVQVVRRPAISAHPEIVVRDQPVSGSITWGPFVRFRLSVPPHVKLGAFAAVRLSVPATVSALPAVKSFLNF